MNPIATLSTKELKQAIMNEAKIRIESGEARDPICVLADELKGGNRSISRTLMEFIYIAHMNGPWVVDNEAKLAIYKDYCEKSGTPIINQKPIMVEGIPVYFDNEGDCVLLEAPKGAQYAVWTNNAKHRIQVGFKTQWSAKQFRIFSPIYSMEATKNRHEKLVVIERNPLSMELVTSVCRNLYDCFNSD